MILSFQNIIENIGNATEIMTDITRQGFKHIVLKFPTKDLDDIYSFHSNGKGYCLRWEGMDMFNEDIDFSVEQFNTLYRHTLNELSNRVGDAN